MALHAPGPTVALPLRVGHVPRPHHPAAHLPVATTVLPLHDAVRPLRSQPRDLPQHLGPPRGDVAAGVGDPDGVGGDSEFYGQREPRAGRRVGVWGGDEEGVGGGE